MRTNTRTAAAMAAAALCVAALAGCSGSGDSGAESQAEAPADFAAAPTTPAPTKTHSPSVNPSDEVGTISAKRGPLGDILVDDKGRTLYLFEADKTKQSTCKDACAKAWPPGLVLTGTPKAGTGGVRENLLSTITRSDGTKQVTYNNHPLYRFEGDKKPGETNGQGLTDFGAKWYVVDTAGKAITTPVSSATKSPGATPTTTATES
ncbi:COG4315 family predicted lipoprotein [Streptomyces odonnellii]|uniref:COG4315 family predicted lipoprotein n=1 Tax=Streptomyces odonnellii TaxID=1417980 RepID=UPI0006267C7D|nr:hypothetical protein [Streptomyces odonnellii]